jgi:putative ABC transport system permease protein
MSSLWLDVRYALRMMVKAPGLTAVLAITLALGIGASTAIFSVVSSVALRPLPYAEPHELVRVYTGGESHGTDFPLSPPEFDDLRKACRSCERIATWASGTASLAGGDRPVRVTATFATADLLPMLGVEPLLGRFYDASEDRPGDPSVMILGYDLWQRAFAGEPSVIGRKITMDAIPVTVIGVMPKGFDFINRAEAWLPANLNIATEPRHYHNWHVLVRLAPNTGLAAFQEELRALAIAWGKGKTPQNHVISPDHPLVAVSFHADVVGSLAKTLWLLQAAVLFVLLISIVNIANLLLARAATRNREVAVRHALGASRRRLLRQFVTESLIIGVLGGGLGLLVAVWAIDGVTALIPRSAPRASEISLDSWAVIFAIACSLLASLLFGAAPILHVRKTDLHGALKEGSNRMAGSKSRLRARRILVITEIALAVVLVIGCITMVRSFVRLQNVELGFKPEHVLTFGIELPAKTYPNATGDAFWHRLEDRLRAIPGVKHASILSGMPTTRLLNAATTLFPGRTPPPEGVWRVDYRHFVGTDTIETLGARLVAGRAIAASDTPDSPPVVMINEAFAAKFFPGEDPIGKRVIALDNGPEQTIVGVVGDMKQAGIDKPPGTEIFLPVYQLAGWFPERNGIHSLWVMVRTAGEPRALEPAVQKAVTELDATLPLFQVRTLDDVMWEATAKPRFLTFLLTCFALIALLLAAVGIYGVMAHTVASRTQEIGLRVALGAVPAQVRAMVLRQAARLVVIGVITGVGAAIALQSLLSSSLDSVLYGSRLSDPLVLGVVAIAVAITALLATLIPVRRATRVEPNVVLKSE